MPGWGSPSPSAAKTSGCPRLSQTQCPCAQTTLHTQSWWLCPSPSRDGQPHSCRGHGDLQRIPQKGPVSAPPQPWVQGHVTLHFSELQRSATSGEANTSSEAAFSALYKILENLDQVTAAQNRSCGSAWGASSPVDTICVTARVPFAKRN